MLSLAYKRLDGYKTFIDYSHTKNNPMFLKPNYI